MKLFNQDQCIDICLKNKNPYVVRAVEDLRKDFTRRSTYAVIPRIIEEENDHCIVIEENTTNSSDPIKDEGFILETSGENLYIRADGYLGTMWGIYTFSEQYLGIDPCYLFNDMPTKKTDSLDMDPVCIKDAPESFGFRGVFINDEDFLTGWKEGGGIRDVDYHWYTMTVDESVMDMVVETILRLKLNLVIPATLLDLDNPPEKLLADCVAKRGIYLSQHHVEPMGLSHFTLSRYCRRFNKEGEYSYIEYPELLEEAWRYYAKKWAEYDNVVWQIGLRGRADRPVWEEADPDEESMIRFGAFISSAIEKQKQIVLEATAGKAKYFTSTLWMEGSRLMEKGMLKLPEDTIMVFADNGPNQMYGPDYYTVPRSDDVPGGIYYHVQYYCCGPHLVPETGLDKLYYNLKLAKDTGDHAYCILNASNIREFVFELGAYSQILWNTDRFSKDTYLKHYCMQYGSGAETMETYIREYFDALPEIDVHYLSRHHEKYFNYDFEHLPEGIKNFIVKEGNVLEHGRDLLYNFHQTFEIPLCEEFYHALLPVIPKYKKLTEKFSEEARRLGGNEQRQIEVTWQNYTTALRYIYEWYVNIYEAKIYRHECNSEAMKKSLYTACSCLETYLEYRKCAEYGDFKNWYRGDLKMEIRQRLTATRRLLGQTPDC